MCYVVGLSSSGKIWCFFAFISFGAAEPLCFCSVFRPFSKVGNPELHTTFFVYFSFCTRIQNESPKTNPCLNPQHISEHKPMPDAGAICPDPQRMSEATNKWAHGSYLNRESIVGVWRAAPFSTVMQGCSCADMGVCGCADAVLRYAVLCCAATRS